MSEMTCCKCGVSKPPADFYFRQSRGKYDPRCKKCIRDIKRSYYVENLVSRREYFRQHDSLPESLARRAAWGRENHHKYAVKNQARILFRQAFLRGDLTRPAACEVCGASDRMRGQYHSLQAHHDDYSMPLNVRWLCTSCHAEYHRTIKLTAAEPKA